MQTLYLIPALLGETPPGESLPEGTLEVIRNLKCFIVENAKSARKFLKSCNVLPPYEGIDFFTLTKHTSPEEIEETFKLLQGRDAGILSEAGCPGVADPGSEMILQAHQKGIKVKPLTGPSSILLGLMSSGFNGQQFTFHGYLPQNSTERIQKIRELELLAIQANYTQIFIETPYRNNALLSDILKTCKPDTLLSIASELTTSNEVVSTASIEEFKRAKPDINDKPAVFLLWRREAPKRKKYK